MHYILQFLGAKDNRIQLMTSVIKNLKFLKTKVLEYFYHFKLYALRQRELKIVF